LSVRVPRGDRSNAYKLFKQKQTSLENSKGIGNSGENAIQKKTEKSGRVYEKTQQHEDVRKAWRKTGKKAVKRAKRN